jgi:hypothetical protein
VVAAVVGAAGCAGVPDSGSVHLAKKLTAVNDDPEFSVRTLPASPTAGMTPDSLVSGFLDAVVDSDSDYAVAREFLVRRTSWNTSAGNLLYDGDPKIRRDGLDGVTVTLTRTGEIDRDGNYRMSPGTIKQHFDVLRVNGQWRISKPPTGVPLSAAVAQQTLQSDSLYFFNRAQTRLVPEPILVQPDRVRSLATTLVHDLLNGPTAALAPAVTTAAPSGVTLVDNVTIDDNGTAEVDLSANAQQLSATALERLSAQIVWTLRQVSLVRAVALVNNNKPLTAIGVPVIQPVKSWSQFAPEVTPTIPGALVTDDGRISGIGMTVPTSLNQRELAAAATSSDGMSVAVVRGPPGNQTLLVGSAYGRLQAPFAASSFTPPAFDPAGDIFTVRGVAPQSTMEELTVDHKIHAVVLPPALRRERISALSVSDDGARIAMVVGPPDAGALYVGVLATIRSRPVIRSVELAVPASDAVSGVAWAGGNEIATTVRTSPSSRAVLTTSVDGYDTTVQPTSGLPALPTSVAAAPGEALLAGADGAVYSLSDGRWSRVIKSGIDPSYPG